MCCVIRYLEDLFYFSLQTVSTVGYGSLAPYTVQSQMISAAFGLVGYAARGGNGKGKGKGEGEGEGEGVCVLCVCVCVCVV